MTECSRGTGTTIGFRETETKTAREPIVCRAEEIGMKTVSREITGCSQTVEENQVRKTIKRIIRIIGLIPILIKAKEVTVDSIQIARRNLKAD